MTEYSHIIIGGGMFGCHVAMRLAEKRPDARIAIIEREPELLTRASYNNQARVHNGYHYPRSVLTGLRSRVNAPRFMKEFADAITADFEQYYAIARRRSKVTPKQFSGFCQQIGADIKPAPAHISAMFNDDLIEAVYAVTEPVFDADKLRAHLWRRLRETNIDIFLESEAIHLHVPGAEAKPLVLTALNRANGQRRLLQTEYVFNCTYSRLNHLLARSGLQTIYLRHEATEMALVDLPDQLRNFSVTVMCGPFFSLMPFPARNLATLSHVSYTPHYSWSEDPADAPTAPHEPNYPLETRFDRMWRDSMRYLPALKAAKYCGSLWETKTILPQSDANDSRPILFKRDPHAPNVISLLGGKIDNIYDLDDLFTEQNAPQPELSLA